MPGLDHIVNRILEDAENEKKQILKQAEFEKKKLIKEREDARWKKSREMLEKANKDAQHMKESILNQAQADARDEMLKTKRTILDEVFLKASIEMQNMNDDEYVKFLKNMTANFKFKDTMISYVPLGRGKAAESVLKTAVLEDETLKSGFVIKDGNIYYDFQIDKLIESKREDLEVKLSDILFKN